MSPQDDFERSQALSKALEQALADLREDVASLVAEEVERRGYSKAQLDKMVAELARREVRKQRRAADPFLYRWAPTLAAVATVLLLAAGWWGWERVRGGDDAPPPGQTAALSPPTTAAPPRASVDDGPPPVEARVARYDSLLDAHADAFDPLVGRLEQATQNQDVQAIIGAWRQRTTTAAQRERLHTALVQLLLREVRPGLGIDGFITRSPCGGSSCPALVEAWTRRASELSYDVPPSPSEADLRVAERLLVLRALEDS